MLRTTFYFPETLHQRLKLVSQSHQKSVSQYAQEALNKVLAQDEAKQVNEMYGALKQVSGFIKDPVTDASTTIDDVLYGEHGAWQGSDQPRHV